MTGNAIIIILLLPTLFQVVYNGIKQAQRHRELTSRLRHIEDRLTS